MALLQAPLPASCEVVVIGGGVSGSSIAHQLAKRGVDVLLLEATELARGASGRNGGLIDAAIDPSSPLMDFYLRASKSFAALAEELETDIEYVQDGSLQILLDSDTDIEETHADFQAHLDLGYPVRWCDRDEVLAMSKLFPENVIGGWLRYEDGQVNPLLLTYALAEAAAKQGAKIRQHTPARGLTVSGERITAVQTDDGEVACDQVVVAIEPWSRPFLAALGLDVPVLPQRGQIFVTEPLPPLMTVACLYGNSPNPYIYWRQTRSGSLTIGGCRAASTSRR
jgi:glycine/D-amino acid oxidase-like deaminating enzyme